MNVGFILWIIGWAIYHGAIVSLFVGLVTIANIFILKKTEEIELESAYGKIYLDYKNGTWF